MPLSNYKVIGGGGRLYFIFFSVKRLVLRRISEFFNNGFITPPPCSRFKIFPHIILILCYTILDATKKICA